MSNNRIERSGSAPTSTGKCGGPLCRGRRTPRGWTGALQGGKRQTEPMQPRRPKPSFRGVGGAKRDSSLPSRGISGGARWITNGPLPMLRRRIARHGRQSWGKSTTELREPSRERPLRRRHKTLSPPTRTGSTSVQQRLQKRLRLHHPFGSVRAALTLRPLPHTPHGKPLYITVTLVPAFLLPFSTSDHITS